MIHHQSPSVVKNKVKIVTKLSRKKIQANVKTPKTEQENNATKS